MHIFSNVFYITLMEFCKSPNIIELSVYVQIMSTNFPNALYMSFLLSPHIFIKDISTTILHRKFIHVFGIQNNSDKLYCGIENQLSYLFLSVFVHFFQYCNFL